MRIGARFSQPLLALISGAFVTVALIGSANGGDLTGVALVIGESDYQQLQPLANPRSDARAIGEMLYALGFEVTSVSDADHRKLTRSIERFIEDAEEADVALVYYSGHGVEVSGDNYLIPIDADIASPESAGASLLSATGLMEELARVAPVTIVLLDACRSNPFAAGQIVRLPGAAESAVVSASGLAAVRGPTPVAKSTASESSLGAVIGFAAEPGRPALDGQPGQNSPYAAALLKHLGAGGYSFGDIMTMVSEEVYLKTEGRQLPWTNSGLRRFLSFGAAGDGAPNPDESAILEGRRDLLLTISSTPPSVQTTVASVAAQQGVPLASLFGVLKAAGIDTDDPEKLSERLIAGAEEIKKRLASISAITNADPEVLRLIELSRRAETEGALQQAVEFGLRASARTTELSEVLDSLAADIDKRRAENASTYAATADTAHLAWEFRTSAEQYGLAVAEAEKSASADPNLVFTYRLRQAGALADLGTLGGDDTALRQAIELYRAMTTIGPPNRSPQNIAAVRTSLAIALAALGERNGSQTDLNEAVASYREALLGFDRSQYPTEWATVENNLGLALAALGAAETGTARLGEAIGAYQLALQERTRERSPFEWASTQNNLAGALFTAGTREGDTEQVEKAIDAYHRALQVRTRDRVPLDWAATQNNLGTALAAIGMSETGPARMNQAAVAFRNALEELPRERVPLQWAAAQSNLGWALQFAGVREDDTARLEESVAAHRLALEVYQPEREPLIWTRAQMGLGLALLELSERTRSRDQMIEGRKASVAAWETYKVQGYDYDGYFTQIIARFDAAIEGLK